MNFFRCGWKIDISLSKGEIGREPGHIAFEVKNPWFLRLLKARSSHVQGDKSVSTVSAFAI